MNTPERTIPAEFTCTLCGFHSTDPLKHFYREPRNRSGLRSWCILCTKKKSDESHQKNYERRKAYQRVNARNYYHRNREQVRARQNAYYRDYYHVKGREQCRRYYQENRDHCLQRDRQYYWANADLVRSRQNRNRWMREAIAWGKDSPITRRTGFSLALRAGSDEVRAARLDRPLLPGEVALVRYEWIAHRRVITPPPIVSPMFRHWSDWALRLCLKWEGK